MTPKEKAFILALTELSKKHGVAVAGCGCCGSPFLVDGIPIVDSGYSFKDEQLEWTDKKTAKKYDTEIVEE